ncbi:MAG: ankyrin repeat domain-containing protein [Pseudomarimonas sp.]
MTVVAPIAHIAAGRTDQVLDFLADGGDAHATDGDGVSLLAWCAYYGDTTALRTLLSAGASLTSLGANFGLHDAAFHGHWQLCQYLLAQGAEVNRPLAETGETALHAALCSDDWVRHDPVVRGLLAAGADVAAVTLIGQPTGAFMRDCRTRGETALHRAAAFASLTTIQRLLDAGASPQCVDANGDSALTWASWHRRPTDILRLLCFGEHHVHPQYVGMRANLVGGPIVHD